MILAVRAYALGETQEMHPDLRLAFRCRRYNKLPVGTGLFDTPEWLLKKIDTALSVSDAYSAYRRKGNQSDADFGKAYPGHLNCVLSVDQMRVERMKAKRKDDRNTT